MSIGSTKCKANRMRRHRESTCRQEQGTRAQMARASPTHASKYGLSVKTSRLTNAQTRTRYAHLGARHAHTKGTFSASTWAMAPDSSLSMFLVMTAALAQ